MILKIRLTMEMATAWDLELKYLEVLLAGTVTQTHFGFARPSFLTFATTNKKS